MYTNMHNFQIFKSVWKIECKFYDLFLLVKWLAKNIRYSQREYLEDFLKSSGSVKDQIHNSAAEFARNLQYLSK